MKAVWERIKVETGFLNFPPTSAETAAALEMPLKIIARAEITLKAFKK